MANFLLMSMKKNSILNEDFSIIHDQIQKQGTCTCTY